MDNKTRNMQPANEFSFGYLATKPLSVSAETETGYSTFYRYCTETKFTVSFGAETEIE